MKKKSFAVIGGDARQLHLANSIIEDNLPVCLFGFDKSSAIPLNSEIAENLDEALFKADYIILPLPCFTKNGCLFAPLSDNIILQKDILSKRLNGKVIFGGKIPIDFSEKLKLFNCNFFDYIKSEESAIINAVPTAEGAISAAISETDITVFNSSCLVTGYGKIGKILSKYLKALGADVYISARKKSDFAYIKSNGFTPIDTRNMLDELDKFDIIFNTVPHLIFSSRELDLIKKDAVIIELASEPGGIDFEYAEKKKIKTIIERGLPGKTAPKTSGKIIWETIKEITKEENHG